MPKEMKPSECPYRNIYGQSYYCEHPKMVSRYCTWTNDPIDYCPMTPEQLRSLKINKILKNEDKSIYNKE